MTGVDTQIAVVSIVAAAVAVAVPKFVFVELEPGPIDVVSCIAQPSMWLTLKVNVYEQHASFSLFYSILYWGSLQGCLVMNS